MKCITIVSIRLWLKADVLLVLSVILIHSLDMIDELPCYLFQKFLYLFIISLDIVIYSLVDYLISELFTPSAWENLWIFKDWILQKFLLHLYFTFLLINIALNNVLLWRILSFSFVYFSCESYFLSWETVLFCKF